MIDENDFKTSSSNANNRYEVQKGRASRRTREDRKLNGPPKYQPWLWLTAELLCSVAWRSMGINCYRLISHLLIEHCNHKGLNNGHLISTYSQLQEYGMTKSRIRGAIDEAEFLGLLRHKRGRRMEVLNQPKILKITYLKLMEQ